MIIEMNIGDFCKIPKGSYAIVQPAAQTLGSRKDINGSYNNQQKTMMGIKFIEKNKFITNFSSFLLVNFHVNEANFVILGACSACSCFLKTK